MKLETFNNKQQTSLEGLWDHKTVYTSTAISLAPMKKFKGYCRIMMKRNRKHKKGDNKPAFLFWIVSADYAEKASQLEFEDIVEDEQTGSWEYTEWNDYYMTTIYEGYQCSSCNEKLMVERNTVDQFEYCPFCGIKMEGVH